HEHRAARGKDGDTKTIAHVAFLHYVPKESTSQRLTAPPPMALRYFGNTCRAGHKVRLWLLFGDGMVFKKGEEQPSGEGKNSPLVLYNVHVPVAVKIADLERVQLPRLEVLLHGPSG